MYISVVIIKGKLLQMGPETEEMMAEPEPVQTHYLQCIFLVRKLRVTSAWNPPSGKKAALSFGARGR